MPQQLPQHKALILSDFGVQLRRVTFSEEKNKPVTYPHQDDYYIIGMVEKGSGSGIIDFKECNFSQGDVFLIQPGQVHRFIGSNDVEGWILFTDSSFVGDAEKNIFDNFLLFASSVKVGIQRMNELKQIASILADRIGRASDKQSKTTARRLTETLVQDTLRKRDRQKKPDNLHSIGNLSDSGGHRHIVTGVCRRSELGCRVMALQTRYPPDRSFPASCFPSKSPKMIHPARSFAYRYHKVGILP